MSVRIMRGDCREVLRSLPDESVHCVVTSPPYWGLRDYGTAKWEGGDSECKHIKSIGGHLKDSTRSVLGGANKVSEAQTITYGNICGKCGAHRIDSQLGLEPTFQLYVDHLVEVFREVRRVLRRDGTLWLNLGDSYNGYMANQRATSISANIPQAARPFFESGRGRRDDALPAKNLIGIPWRVAFALQADGWYLRQDLIWSKPNPMPESVRDRCTKAHEYIFLLSKNERYYYDAEAIAEPAIFAGKSVVLGEKSLSKGQADGANVARHGNALVDAVTVADTRNRRSVWEIATAPFSEAHFAAFPPALIEPCILAGTSAKGCCAKCGAPYIRMQELISTDGRKRIVPASTGPAFRDVAVKNKIENNSKIRASFNAKAGLVRRADAGWEPSCKCEAGLRKPVVLDPFGGSGTTGMVAQRLGRDSIMIELSEKYVEIMERRLHNDSKFAALAPPPGELVRRRLESRKFF